MLVLSLFPGIGILDRAFEAEGFTIVRGPDLLWGGDIRRFHVPAGRFDGVIGGSPCQAFTRLAHLIRWLGEVQSRLHRFSFGTHDGGRLHFETTVFEPIDFQSRVLAKHDALPQLRRSRQGQLVRRGGVSARRGRGNYRTVEACCELQGLPADFFANSPFTRAKQRQMLGNAVPYPMGRELARAIRRALGLPLLNQAADEPPSALTHDPGPLVLPARAGSVAAGQGSLGVT